MKRRRLCFRMEWPRTKCKYAEETPQDDPSYRAIDNLSLYRRFVGPCVLNVVQLQARLTDDLLRSLEDKGQGKG